MSEQVRGMFSDISAQYDLLNDLLSLGKHRCWKRNLVNRLNLPSNGKHLDVATGTGDIAELVVRKYDKSVSVTGVDFSESMIIKANYRKNPKHKNLSFKIGDATNLEYSDNYFDSLTISFGIRNIPELVKSINEMARVIKPGGIFAVMEFGTPSAPFNIFYQFYSKFIIPTFGRIMSGNNSAYSYLPETIKKFPYGNEFKEILESTGNFSEVNFNKLDFGVVYIYICKKKSES